MLIRIYKSYLGVIMLFDIKSLISISNQDHFDQLAEQLKTDLLAADQQKFVADKVCLNYFADTDKLTLKNFVTGSKFTHTFNNQNHDTNHVKPLENKYFRNKKININSYQSIRNDRNNWVIPIYDIDFNEVSTQNIYYDLSLNSFQKRNKGDISGNFFFCGNPTSEIMVISEGVATVLAFSEYIKLTYPDLFYVSAITASNMEKVIRSLCKKLNLIKVIIVLTDNDDAGKNAFDSIKKLNLGNTLIYQIISNNEEENDFSDIYINKTQLSNIDIHLQHFMNNNGIYLNQEQEEKILKTLEAKNKMECFKNNITETYINNLEQFKVKIANNSIYAINPKISTYQEITTDHIEEFVGDCVSKTKIYNLDISREAERIYKLLRRMRVFKSSFDTAINCKNGSVDLTIREFQSKYKATTKYVGFRYYDDEEYQNKFNNSSIQQFLYSTLPNDEDLLMLQDCIGYLLTNNKQEYLVMLCGSGSNGKSVLLELIKKALPELTVSASLDNVLNNDNSRALIKDKLLAVSSEFSGVIKQPETFKTMISREPLQYKELYKDISVMENYARFIVASNELPIASTLNSNALVRRLAVLEFKQVFKPNQDYTENLYKPENIELFFNYLIRCAFNYNYEIRISTNSKELLNNIKTGIDSVYGFLQEEEITSGDHLISASELYQHYLKYCFNNSIKENNSSNFGRKMSSHNIQKKRLAKGFFYMINKDLKLPPF